MSLLTVAARDNDSPIAKHCSGMRPAAIDKIAGQSPNSGGRVINLRCWESAREIHGPARYKHSAIGKQSLGVVRTSYIHAASCAPRTGCRVIKLGGLKYRSVVGPARNQNATVKQ